MREKKGLKYDTIKIPEGLTKIIDAIVEEEKGNFTSRTDVIKYAVRKYQEEREQRLNDGRK